MTKRPDPASKYGLVVEIARGQHATIAHVHSNSNASLLGIGDSKRAPGDMSSQLVGDNLAVARAFRDLADQLQDSADRLGEALNPTPFEHVTDGSPCPCSPQVESFQSWAGSLISKITGA